jgi:hypothetical protein
MKDAVARDAIQIKAPFAELQDAITHGRLESPQLNQVLMRRYGVFIVRQHFDHDYICAMATTFEAMLASGEIKRSPHHKTEVRFRPDQPFAKIIENRQFLSLAKQFFGGEVALDFMRIVKKDTVDRDPVFLHQDAGYQVGRFDAYSFFIPLTECGVQNGGLAFYPGTHNFGHLGDVGGIAPVLPKAYPMLQPTVDVGDVLIMHSGIWHFSTPNISGKNRVYLEVNIRAADDPAAKQSLGCAEQREWILNVGVSDLFESSREQRIKALYQEINELKQRLADLDHADR